MKKSVPPSPEKWIVVRGNPRALDELDEFLTVEQAAAALDAAERAVEDAVREGRIPAVEIGGSLRMQRDAFRQAFRGSLAPSPQADGSEVRTVSKWERAQWRYEQGLSLSYDDLSVLTDIPVGTLQNWCSQGKLAPVEGSYGRRVRFAHCVVQEIGTGDCCAQGAMQATLQGPHTDMASAPSTGNQNEPKGAPPLADLDARLDWGRLRHEHPHYKVVKLLKTLPADEVLSKDPEAFRRRVTGIRLQYPGPDAPIVDWVPIFVRERLEKFVDADLRRSTLASDYYALKGHILPDFGGWPVSEVRLADLKHLRRFWRNKSKRSGEPYAPDSVNTWLKVLRNFLSDIWTNAGLGECPAIRVEDLSSSEAEAKSLTAAELQQFLPKMKELYPQHYAMNYLGFTVGCRFGALSALQWKNVDFEHGEVRMRLSHYLGTTADGTKTKKYKDFPLPDRLARVLREHRQNLVVKDVDCRKDDLVFPGDVDDPEEAALNGHMSLNTLNDAMKSVQAALGWEEKVTSKSMRRTLTTLMTASGATRMQIKAVSGHDTDRMVDHYANPPVSEKAKFMAPFIAQFPAE